MNTQNDGHYPIDELLRLCLSEEFDPEGELPGEAASLIRLMNELPGGFLIYCADREKQILYANRTLLRMVQCSTLDEFLAHTGSSFRGLVHPDDLDETEGRIRAQLSVGQDNLSCVEYRIRRRDGAVRWMEDYSRFAHSEAAGDIFYVFLTDTTNKRERSLKEKAKLVSDQQELLADALAKENAAISSKNAFLSNMSHDMRTPLNAIFGFTSLAKLNLDDREETLDYLDRVETASRQLLDMIDKVLEVSSLSDAAGAELVECELRDILQKVYDFLQPQAQEKDITFVLNSSSLRHSAVYADQEKLNQLLLYLANNAVTYTNPGGHVSITAEEVQVLPHDYVVYRLIVADDGIGISPEFIEKIFEPFSREKNSTLSGVHGIGLGLTIAKDIVEMMGGILDVSSEVGKGSTFTVSLTLRSRTRPAGQDISAGSIQRLLLAEDNDINREIEAELLTRMGFVIEAVKNGKEALEKITYAAPGHYDLIVMDLQMPVMNGWEASRAIRALPDPAQSKIPIVALSANGAYSALQRSKDSGIDAHLVKPIDLALLLDTIEALTDKKRPEQRTPWPGSTPPLKKPSDGRPDEKNTIIQLQTQRKCDTLFGAFETMA